MNRRIILACIVITMIFLFPACTSGQPASSLEVWSIGEYDGAAFDSQDPVSLWSYEQVNPHEDKQAAARAEGVFNGEVFSGRYEYSAMTEGNLYISDTYSGVNGMFSINRSTGEIDSVFPLGGVSIENPDRTAYEKLARDVAKQYIDIDEYTLTVDDKGEGIWAFHYFRVIDGMTAWDGLDIVMDGGRVVAFAKYMTEEFAEGLRRIGEDKVKAFIESAQSEEGKKAIEDKITWGGKRKASFEPESVNLVLLPGDHLGVLYHGTLNIELEITDVQKSQTISSRASFLVTEKGVIQTEVHSDTQAAPDYEDVIYLSRTPRTEEDKPEKTAIKEGARAVQDILFAQTYEPVLYDSAYPFTIYVGEEWYGYNPGGSSFLNKEGYGYASLSNELNLVLRSLLSIPDDWQE